LKECGALKGDHMNAKFTGTQIAILAALTLAVVVVFCIGGILMLSALLAASKPSEQTRVVEIGATPQTATTVQPTNQRPSTVAALPTATTSPNQSLTFEQITNTAKQLTELKRNDYYKSLIGKSVHWTGKVADVSDSGEVRVRIVTTISYDVVVQGVPKTTYTKLNLNDVVEFDGTITDVSDMFGSGLPKITVKSTALNSQASVTNPTPTSPSQSLTFEQITSTTKQLTELKRNDYYKSLIGKSIHWTGKVADVSDSGEVHVRILTTTISYDVALLGVPKSTYTRLNLNDPVEFDGTITDVSDMFGSGLPKITVKATTVKSQ
jgi:hypothetical protein